MRETQPDLRPKREKETAELVAPPPLQIRLWLISFLDEGLRPTMFGVLIKSLDLTKISIVAAPIEITSNMRIYF